MVEARSWYSAFVNRVIWDRSCHPVVSTERKFLNCSKNHKSFWEDQRQQVPTGTQGVTSEHQETFLLWGMTKHWLRLPKEVVESPCLEMPQVMWMCSWALALVALPEPRSWTNWSLEASSHIYMSMILSSNQSFEFIKLYMNELTVKPYYVLRYLNLSLVGLISM